MSLNVDQKLGVEIEASIKEIHFVNARKLNPMENKIIIIISQQKVEGGNIDI